MKKSQKTTKLYVTLLVACVCSLALLVSVITFGNSKYVPTWQQIGQFFTGNEASPDEDYVCFIDVGQGDSILISSNGYNALIDFGNKSDYGSNLLDSLRSHGIKELDCVILSHYDNDHVGGASKVVEALPVHYAVLPELDDQNTDDFADLSEAFEKDGTQDYTAKVGTVINIGDCEMTVIGYSRNASNSNDSSVLIMAKLGNKKFLFTGDAGATIERQLISDGVNVDCDVFKAAHHGSKNSNTKEFVAAASPEYAVISVGESNRYGHPHEEVLDVFSSVGVKVYRTDRSGDITFKVINGELFAETEY